MKCRNENRKKGWGVGSKFGECPGPLGPCGRTVSRGLLWSACVLDSFLCLGAMGSPGGASDQQGTLSSGRERLEPCTRIAKMERNGWRHLREISKEIREVVIVSLDVGKANGQLGTFSSYFLPRIPTCVGST